MKRFLYLLAFLLPLLTAAQDEKSIHTLIDNWHLAASQAKAEPFFNAMANDAIYIGTADFERWTKDEFRKFALPYFNKGKAWDFKPYDRDLHVSIDGQYAWFSELLSTWMGVCRGSGVLVKKDGEWKISQYHLSVTVPNEIIGDFIKLVDGFKQQKSK